MIYLGGKPMRVLIFVERLHTRWKLGFFLFLFLAAYIIQLNSSLPVSTGVYKIRESFPPLIFLPGYRQGPQVYSSSSVLIESRSGAVLYAKNEDQRRAPASTTKMMTAIVALEKGNLDQIVKISPRTAGTPGSSIYLRPGELISIRELLKGMMLQSGNDGSMGIAEGISGSMENFAALMNLKAKEIGALNTNFQNPHGLRAPSHYTTALDLALIARYGLAMPQFAGLVKQKKTIIKWAEQNRQLGVTNTNRLLWGLEGADGVKTGTTSEAGHCLVASATRDGKQLIAVVLNSGDRWGDCSRLLEYGFRDFSIIKIAGRQQVIGQLPVKKGRYSKVRLYPRRDLIAVVQKGSEKMLAREVEIYQDPVSAPLKPGQTLGRIGYKYRGTMVEWVDLINRSSIPARKRWWL
jgi:D-alanyl-D-alanine carboxypeptidase (penicillin-binding protein 5/6)